MVKEALKKKKTSLKVLLVLTVLPQKVVKARLMLQGMTALMAATGIGRKMEDLSAGTEAEILAAAKYLLALGVDVDAVNRTGETAMHGAAYKSLPKMVRFLAEHGAKLDVWNQPNRSGWTPLMIAEGHRPGNFKPSQETIDAIHRVFLANGVTPPPPTPRKKRKGYQ